MYSISSFLRNRTLFTNERRIIISSKGFLTNRSKWISNTSAFFPSRHFQPLQRNKYSEFHFTHNRHIIFKVFKRGYVLFQEKDKKKDLTKKEDEEVQRIRNLIFGPWASFINQNQNQEKPILLPAGELAPIRLPRRWGSLLSALALLLIYFLYSEWSWNWKQDNDIFPLAQFDVDDPKEFKKRFRYLRAYTLFGSIFPHQIRENSSLVELLIVGSIHFDPDVRRECIQNLTILAMDPYLTFMVGKHLPLKLILETLKYEKEGDTRLTQAVARLMHFLSRSYSLQSKFSDKLVLSYLSSLLKHPNSYIRSDISAVVYNLTQMGNDSVKVCIVPLFELFVSSRPPEFKIKNDSPKANSSEKKSSLSIQERLNEIVDLFCQEWDKVMNPETVKLVEQGAMELKKIIKQTFTQTPGTLEEAPKAAEKVFEDISNKSLNSFLKWIEYYNFGHLRETVRTHIRTREALRALLKIDPYILDKVMETKELKIPSEVIQELIWVREPTAWEQRMEQTTAYLPIATTGAAWGVLWQFFRLKFIPNIPSRKFQLLGNRPVNRSLISRALMTALGTSFFVYIFREAVPLYSKHAEAREPLGAWRKLNQNFLQFILPMIWVSLHISPIGSLFAAFFTIPSVNQSTLRWRILEAPREDWTWDVESIQPKGPDLGWIESRDGKEPRVGIFPHFVIPETLQDMEKLKVDLASVVGLDINNPNEVHWLRLNELQQIYDPKGFEKYQEKLDEFFGYTPDWRGKKPVYVDKDTLEYVYPPGYDERSWRKREIRVKRKLEEVKLPYSTYQSIWVDTDNFMRPFSRVKTEKAMTYLARSRFKYYLERD